MVAVNGAHLHPNTKGTYVLISENQRIDLSGDLLSDFFVPKHNCPLYLLPVWR